MIIMLQVEAWTTDLRVVTDRVDTENIEGHADGSGRRCNTAD